MNILERFRSKSVLMESGCHEWRSTLHRDGYGKFWFDGQQAKAHRVSYLLNVGEIPNGEWVLHRCANGKCVNPDHLYLGDVKQNARDRTDRLRYATRKIAPELVPVSRDRYAEGGVTQQTLADEFGVHQAHISKIVRGKQRLAK